MGPRRPLTNPLEFSFDFGRQNLRASHVSLPPSRFLYLLWTFARWRYSTFLFSIQIFAETTLVSIYFTTASALAPLLFRASPIDPILRPASVPISEGEFERFTNAAGGSSDTRAPSPLPPPSIFGNSLSRASSTSTQNSSAVIFQQQQPQFHTRGASLSQPQNKYNLSLPGLSALANAASASPSQQRSFSSNAVMNFAAAPTPGIAGNTPPVCQNCQTSTTPLWRRDEAGSVLCNACGLFLKLHGRPRPISLKTDVIKSRNRVKSANQGPKHKNGLPASQSIPQHPPDFMTPNSQSQHRRVSQMAMSTGGSERSASPLSRVDTPTIGLNHDPNIAPPHIFEGITLNDGHFSGTLPPLNQPSPGSSINGDRHLEPPTSYDQLVSHNNALRTKVNELQLINMMITESEATLRRERDSANATVDELRSRIRQLEQRDDSLERPSKKMKMSDVTNE